MTELELSVRHKELIKDFKAWLREGSLEVWSCDDLRMFLNSCEKPYRELFWDQAEKTRLNLGGFINATLNALNPNHRSKWVGSTTKTKHHHRVGLYTFVSK